MVLSMDAVSLNLALRPHGRLLLDPIPNNDSDPAREMKDDELLALVALDLNKALKEN